RSASTAEVVRSISLSIPDLLGTGTGMYVYSYLFTRPQYSPDGAWLYFWLGGLSLAVSPSTGEKRLLDLGSESFLSPDGKTLATLRKTLALRSTDGERAVFVRLQHEPRPFSGIAWTGNNTVAVLSEDIAKNPVQPVVDIYDTDGHLLRSDPSPGGPTN